MLTCKSFGFGINAILNFSVPFSNLLLLVDRYVILGAHYDSLTSGARDNGGSVAVLLEIMTVLHKLYAEKQWKPRRTILFAFWDAEELGQIGSTEFIEVISLETDSPTFFIL